MTDKTSFTLPLRTDLLDRVDRLAVAQTRRRNGLLNRLIEVGLNLERLPAPKQGEKVDAYHERLQRISDGGQ